MSFAAISGDQEALDFTRRRGRPPARGAGAPDHDHELRAGLPGPRRDAPGPRLHGVRPAHPPPGARRGHRPVPHPRGGEAADEGRRRHRRAAPDGEPAGRRGPGGGVQAPGRAPAAGSDGRG